MHGQNHIKKGPGYLTKDAFRQQNEGNPDWTRFVQNYDRNLLDTLTAYSNCVKKTFKYYDYYENWMEEYRVFFWGGVEMN